MSDFDWRRAENGKALSECRQCVKGGSAKGAKFKTLEVGGGGGLCLGHSSVGQGGSEWEEWRASTKKDQTQTKQQGLYRTHRKQECVRGRVEERDTPSLTALRSRRRCLRQPGGISASFMTMWKQQRKIARYSCRRLRNQSSLVKICGGFILQKPHVLRSATGAGQIWTEIKF